MDIELHNALRSIHGVSPVADDIIARRFGDFRAESAAAESSDSEMTSDQYDDLIGDILNGKYVAPNSDAQKLLFVVMRLLDRLSEKEDASASVSEFDENIDDFEWMSKFRSRIQGARVGDLRVFYSESLFRTLKQSTRQGVATVLVEYCDSIGKEPNDLWTNLSQNGGIL